MFKTYYKICVEGHNIRSFIKMLYKLRISLISIKTNKNFFYAIVDDKNFNKIMNIKTSYNIRIIRTYGFNYFKDLLINNFFFLLFSFLGIVFVVLLSNIIFDVEIVHNDSLVKDKLYVELEKYDIKKSSLIKSYEYIQEVKKRILEFNKDDIEWLEIERIGTKYVVRFEERIINKKVEDTSKYRHIVALKEGIIKKIDAENGEVSVKVNDYVAKGDILISGEIHKNEDILGNTAAKGNVYAEVWYKAKVTIPINYYEKKYTGNNKNVINFSLLNFNYNLFDFKTFKEKSIISNTIYSDFFDIFRINYNKEEELSITDNVILMTNDDIAVKIAREKLESKLKNGEYIIAQKKLKTSLNNSTIRVEVFFKVYENISQYKYYKIGEVIE